MNWTAPTANAYAVSGYKIEQSTDGFTDPNNTTVEVENTASTALVRTVDGLEPKTEYHYRIYAINTLGTGDASATVNETTFAVPEPVDDLAGSVSGNNIVLTWTEPDDNLSLIHI